MGYMQIATKHMSKQAGALQTDQTDPQAPKTPNVAKPTNTVKKVTKPKAKVVPAVSQPVPGTPYAALAGLIKNGKK